jgi:hypothetical protein
MDRLTCFAWLGPQDCQDIQGLSLVVEGLRKPFRSLLCSDDYGFLVAEVLAEFSLPRLSWKCSEDDLVRKLHRFDPDGFLLLTHKHEAPQVAKRLGTNLWQSLNF